MPQSDVSLKCMTKIQSQNGSILLQPSPKNVPHIFWPCVVFCLLFLASQRKSTLIKHILLLGTLLIHLTFFHERAHRYFRNEDEISPIRKLVICVVKCESDFRENCRNSSCDRIRDAFRNFCCLVLTKNRNLARLGNRTLDLEWRRKYRSAKVLGPSSAPARCRQTMIGK